MATAGLIIGSFHPSELLTYPARDNDDDDEYDDDDSSSSSSVKSTVLS